MSPELAELYSRGAPIVLTSTVSVLSGQVANCTLTDLQPRSRAPLVVDEILFETQTPTPEVGRLPTDNRGQIRWRLQAGPHAMTNGFVPTWLFAPVYQDGAEEIYGNSPYNIYYLRWKLPEPMFLPTGYVLNASCFRDTAVDVFAVARGYWASDAAELATISLHGRVLDPDVSVPTSVIPFVSAATFDDFSIFNGERDLKNTIDTSIRIQRFVGRIQQMDENIGIIDGWATQSLANYLVNSFHDSKGYNIINQPTPWWALFPPERRAWTFNRVLPPGEQFTVGLGQTPAAGGQPMISFVGSRTETVG